MWREEQLFFDGDEFFDALIAACDRAQKRIELETYIFKDDPIGRRIEDALKRATARGVKVRLLVDGIGASPWIDRRPASLEAAGVEIKVYHPVKFFKVARRLWREIGLSRNKVGAKRSSAFTRLNRRDHRKVCIIDGETAWVGSLNVTGVHCKSVSGAAAWRDTAVRIQGPDIEALSAAFEYAWHRSHNTRGKRRWRDRLPEPLWIRRRRNRVNPLVRLNYTRRLRRRNLRDFLRRMRGARKRLWITNAYLAPSGPILRALARAARQGADVRLLVPRESDVFFMPWVATAHYIPLLRSGVRIFEYLPSFLHAKSIIIDDWASVGTSNLNRRSLLFDFEVDIVISKPETLKELEERFLADLEQAEEIHKISTGLRALLGRSISFVFRDWI